MSDKDYLKRTLKLARSKVASTPFRDGDRISFGHTDLSDAPIVSRHFLTQVEYFVHRLNGESHNMAEIFATRAFPGLRTDAIFNEGRFSGTTLEKCPAHMAWLRSQAEAEGVSVSGKYYLSGLADYPGDPTAWVSDRGDVKRVLEAKNCTVRDGMVTHVAHEAEPVPDIAIADDIIEREVVIVMAENPGARREDVRERVYALRSGAVDPNPLLCNDYDESDIDATV